MILGNKMKIKKLYQSYTGVKFYDDNKIQRAFALCFLSFENVIPKPKGWLKKKCPTCKIKLDKKEIKEFSWTYICYSCSNCDYEWGKYG